MWAYDVWGRSVAIVRAAINAARATPRTIHLASVQCSGPRRPLALPHLAQGNLNVLCVDLPTVNTLHWPLGHVMFPILPG